MKKIKNLTFGTPEYVVAHGKRQLRRKKGLSAILLTPCEIRNTRKAFKTAQILTKRVEKVQRRRPMFNLFGQTELEEALGIPAPGEPPWPGATRIPHTCYEWY